LELTLKHVKALNNLLEQQQQKIISLQNGMQIGEFTIMQCVTVSQEAALLNFSPPVCFRAHYKIKKLRQTCLCNAANDLD